MTALALLSMLPFMAPVEAGAPADGAMLEWVHLIPAGTSYGVDGRGPWTLEDPQAVILASEQYLPAVFDEVHSTDLAAPRGESAPARGWIQRLEARPNGIWGQVEWTPTGRQLRIEKAYRGTSPAIGYDKDTGRILSIRRASLTNTPNLGRQLVALNHQESHEVDLITRLRALHGLPATADEAAVVTACTAAHSAAGGVATALNSIAAAAGVSPGQDAAQLATAIAALRGSAGAAGQHAQEVMTLQSEVTNLRNGIARDRATAAIDAAMRAGKPITPGIRGHYIDRHMANPEAVQRELDALPALNSGGIIKPPPSEGDDGAPGAEEKSVLALLGVDPTKYAAEKKRLGLTEEAA